METLTNANGNVVTLNYNLRQPKGNKLTNVYAIIKVEGRQIKMPIGEKINSWQWDKKKQLPKVSGNMTEDDRQNAMHVMAKINALNVVFSEYYLYLCTNNVLPTEKGLKEFINENLKINDMANKNAIPPKRSVTATKLLNDAFIRRYGTEENPTTKIGSWKAYKRQLQQFLDYIKGNANVYDSVSTLSKKGIFNYKEWLEDNARKQGKGDSKTIAQKCNTIILLINDIAENPNFDKYKIEHLQPYKFAKSLVKNDEKKVRALTNEEVRVVMECELNDRLNMYREVFTMQLETGVRFSDLNKLFLHEYTTNEKDGQKTLTIKTQKETITAVIIVNDTIESLIEKYNSGLPIKLDEQVYNEALKEIFEIAKLTNTEIYYKDFLGTKKEESGRLCDLVSNNWARHTFITNKVREGWNIDTLTYCTGHANDQQIKQVYAHITEDDKINKALKENARVQGNKIEDGAKNIDGEFAYNKGMEAKENELIKEAKEALLFLGANYEDIADINNLDELSVLLYTDYSTKFNTMGIDLMKLKGIFNTPNATLKEKKDILQKVIDETKAKNEWYLQMQWKKAMQEEKEYISFEDYKMYIKQRAKKILSVE